MAAPSPSATRDAVATAWVDVVRVAPARAVIVLAECPDHVDPGALTRVRAGALAIGGLDLPPDLMLQRMDTFVGECGVGFPISMMYAAVDAVRSTLRVASAGAPPPLFLHGDEVAPVPVAVGPPVGLGAAYARVQEQSLPDRAVIAFSTTLGLAAGPDSASHVHEVAAILGSRGDRALGDLADDLTVVARRHPVPAPITLVRRAGDHRLAVEWRLPATRQSVTQGRHLIDAALSEWPGSTIAMRHDVRLVATELLSRLLTASVRAVTLRLALTGDGVLIEVRGVPTSSGLDADASSGVTADLGRTLVADLSMRCGHRWASASPEAWAQVPWTIGVLPRTVESARSGEGAIGA